MARQDGRPTTDLKKDLFEKPRAYSFFQAVRLLKIFAGETGSVSDERLFHDILRVRPFLSLSFPGTDLVDVEELAPNAPYKFLLTATFLGLYGPSSPLPTHYTEDLLDEASNDHTVTRDFLDIFSSPFYRLFFKGWSRSRWYVKITEEEAAEYLERLFCLVGLGSDEFRAAVPQARGFLRYIGLFTQFPRSAMGLATLLTDALDVPHVEVVPHVKRRVRIPDDQRMLLGDQSVALGDDTHLGEEIEDRMGKIGIKVHGLNAEKFHAVLPGQPLFDQIYSLTDTYLNQPLERELELVLDAKEIETVVLGGEAWSHLGYDTWTFSTPHMVGEASVTFRLGPFC